MPLPDDLPPELIAAIFKSGARLSKQFCVTLCLVCSWSRNIALPYLYHTVIVRDQTELDAFNRCLNARIAPFVENLYIWSHRSRGSCFVLIEACRSVKHLATSLDTLFARDNSPYVEYSHRVRTQWGQVSLTLMDGIGSIRGGAVSSRHPILRHVTRVHFGGTSFSWPTSTHPLPFPQLTHLAITLHWRVVVLRSDGLEDLLQHHPSLKMILIIFPLDTNINAFAIQPALEWFWERRQRNPKMFLLEISAPEAMAGWIGNGDGKPDVWERGERFTLEQVEIRNGSTGRSPSSTSA